MIDKLQQITTGESHNDYTKVNTGSVNRPSKKIGRVGNDSFLQGFVCAVVILIRLNKCVDTNTKEVYRAGVGKRTLSDLKKSGIDEYDLSQIEEYWEDLH